MRRGHKGHPDCEYTSRAACERARRIAIGQCVSMLDENRQCPNWGVDTVDGRGYCGQHVGTVYRVADERRRAATAKEAMDARIDDYLSRTGQTAHVCGPRCRFSSIPV